MKSAIQSTVDKTKTIVENSGVNAGISFLNTELANPRLTQILLDMVNEVGLRFARKTWIDLNRQKRQAKGFGFNAEWVAWIKRWLYDFIVQEVSFKIFETTKDTLLKVLSQSIEQGLGITETVKLLDELNLSEYQAARIVRTEITRATNAGVAAASETFPYQQQKMWISAHDNRVRGLKPKDHASHIGLDGTVVNYEDVFHDPRNGDELKWPGDPEAKAESTVNCRCSIGITAKLNEDGDLIAKPKTTSIIYPSNRRMEIITI